MKYLLSILVAVVFNAFSFAQETGSVTGKIVASDSSPIDNATVTVNGTKFGGKTNAQGEFEFKNLKAGNYTLKVTHVNFSTKETPFKITASQNTALPSVQLSTRNETLNEINVSGNSNKYTKRESDYVSRMPIKNLENSQVYSVVTKELMKDQLVTNQDEALKNIPGLYQIWGSTNRAGDGGSYFASRGFVTQSLLRNGIVGRVTSNSDAANLERIESIKGPSATLFGSILTSYGGLINRVTKKPYDGFGGEISYQGGSYSFNRITADINTPVNEDHTALFRVNAAYNNANTFQDFGFNRSFFVAPSFSYQVNEKLNVSIEAEISNVEAAGMPLIYIPWNLKPSDIGIFNAKDIPMDFKRSFHGGDFITTTKSFNVFAQALYQFNDKWSSQSVFSSGSNRASGIQTWFYLLPNTEIERDAWNANGRDNAMEFQQNFNGDFNIGSIRNRVLIGGDVLHTETNLTYGYLNNGLFTKVDTISYTDETATNYFDFNPTNVAELFVNAGDGYRSRSDVTTLSAYAADVINVTDNLIVSAAVRFDHYIDRGTYNSVTGKYTLDYTQNFLSPKFGLVYQIVKDHVSVFGNYQNSFKNVGFQNVNVDGALEQQKFDPEQANQYEGGVKLNVFQNKLSANLSYYNIKVEDIVRSDGTPLNGSVQDGNQISKGFELEVTGNPIPGLNFTIGYAKNDSKLEKADVGVNGLRPTTAGPENLINYWISYNLQSTKLKGLGFGFGGNYADESLIYNQRASVDAPVETFTLPSYAIVNASINYDQPKYRIAFKANNISNEEYFNGYTTINVQNPRTFFGSVTYKF